MRGQRGPAQSKDHHEPASGVMWTCHRTQDESSRSDSLTVGQKFGLYCTGPDITPWTLKPQFRFTQPELEYSLVVLDMTRVSRTSVDLIVTGYKSGEFKLELLDLVGPEGQVHVQGLTWKIESVLKGQAQPQPYPPYGPFLISWPLWLWLILIGILLLIGGGLGWKWYGRWSRQKALRKSAPPKVTLKPYEQFHKELRFLWRRYQGRVQVDQDHRPQDYVLKLNESLRHYLTRELAVPAMVWSDRAVLKDIQRRHQDVFRVVGLSLRSLLRELGRAKNSQETTFVDGEQLHSMCRQVVDLIDQGRRESL